MSEEFFLDRMVAEYPGVEQAVLMQVYRHWMYRNVSRQIHDANDCGTKPCNCAQIIAYHDAQIAKVLA